MANNFRYVDLQKRQSCAFIRVLLLDPAPNFEDALVGSLATENIIQGEHCLTYEALSYTWGESPKHATLILQGNIFQIGANLDAALRRLRTTKSVRKLWVDAVCINQMNMEEKTEQIAMMGRIYGKAQQVLVWLGEADNDDMIFGFLSWASPHSGSCPWRRGRSWQLPPISELVEQYDLFKASDSSPQDHNVRRKNITVGDIQDFCNRSWFSRRWIVQEICNAQGIVVHFGRNNLGWDDFSGAISTLISAPDHMRRLKDQTVSVLLNYRDGVHAYSILRPIESLQAFKGSDDRDRIAAFLGLGWPSGLDGTSFVVDYSKCVEENYFAFAVHMVQLGYGANLLVTAANSFRASLTSSNLPSWVPDWRRVQWSGLSIDQHAKSGIFDINLESPDVLTFHGQICGTFTSDLPTLAEDTPCRADSAPGIGGQRTRSVPQKDDLVCYLVSVDQLPSGPCVVLRKSETTEAFTLIQSAEELWQWDGFLKEPLIAKKPRIFKLQ